MDRSMLVVIATLTAAAPSAHAQPCGLQETSHIPSGTITATAPVSNEPVTASVTVPAMAPPCDSAKSTPFEVAPAVTVTAVPVVAAQLAHGMSSYSSAT